MTEFRKKRSIAGVTAISQQRAAAPRTATRIYNVLLEDIVSLRRKPLELLNEKELQVLFGVSRTPIREAILRLADEGLVDVYPQAGTFISRIPKQAVYEAILVRKALENTTVSIAAEKITPIELKLLDRNLDDMIDSHKADDLSAFHRLDNEFHEKISQISGFPGIWSIVEQVKVHSDRYRLLTLPQEGRFARVIDEHAMVITCLHRRDKQGAANAMDRHLGLLLDEIQQAQKLDPDYFI
ncbi:GntR family transcriptional regulator [Paraburkholderia aspalathi]|nr:GntR family transcriptional regulator [Paraburkholderia aspalathi]